MYRKKSGDFFSHIDFMSLDLICMLLIFWLSFWKRQGTPHIFEDSIYPNLMLIIFVAQICFITFGAGYRGILRRSIGEEFKAVFRQILIVVLALLLYLFLMKASVPRSVMVSFSFFSFLFIFIEHILWKKYVCGHLKRHQRLMLLVADRESAGRIIRQMSERIMDFCISGVVLAGEDSGKMSSDAPEYIGDVLVVADFSTLLSYIKEHAVDEILFSIPNSASIPASLIQQCRDMGLSIHLELTGFNNISGSRMLENISGVSVLTVYTRLVTSADAFLKRAMDIAGSVVGLLLTGILSIFLVPAIYFSDPGPVFFSQERVGLNGRIFRIYKFRSMYRDAEARKKELMEKNQMKGFMFKLDADPRIIGSGPDGTHHGLGHFIRATSLDEFPQFWNVLRGDMSLVGTRPPTVDEWQQYDLHHRARLAVKPGITGLWQVSGRSDITDFEEVVKLDTEYIQSWSIWLDLKILWKTVGVVLFHKGAK